MTIFAADLYFIGVTKPIGMEAGEYLPLITFTSNIQNLRAAFDLLMIGFSAGFYIVPLTSRIQLNSDDKFRSRVIASLNIVNAIYMVAAAIFSIVLLSFGLTVLQIFLIVAIINIFQAIPLLRR